MLPPSIAGSKRDRQSSQLPPEEKARQRTQKRARTDSLDAASAPVAVQASQHSQGCDYGRNLPHDEISIHNLVPTKLSGIDELSFIASLEAENQANGGWDPSSQYMYSHDIGGNIAVEASWLTDFAMQHTIPKPSHDPYAWLDAPYGPCAVSPPCTDPACDDILPCPEQCDPSACLGDICYDEECLPEHQVNDLCCEQPCPIESKCASFCSGPDCVIPHCDSSNGHVSTTQRYNSQHYDQLTGEFTPFHFQSMQHGCVEPTCLSQDHCHLAHNLDHTAHEHIENHHSFSSIQPSRKGTDYNTPSTASRIPYTFHGQNTHNFDPRPMSSYLHSLGPNWSRFMVHGADGDRHLGSATPELTMSFGNTPATLSPLTSQGSQNSSTQRDNLICRWAHIPHGSALQTAVCNQVFESAEELHQHVEKSHIDSLPREDREGNGFFCHWFACDRLMCRSFQARPKLKRHMQTHTLYKPYTCARCGVQMKTKDAMEKHERTHTGERPYECKVAGCKKIFATSTELKTHMVVHSGEKPHECPICHECFADSSNLSKHKKTHYAPRFVCPEPGCDARTKRWDQMRRHLQTQNHGPPELLTDRKAQEAYKAQLDLKFEDNGDDDSVPVRSSSKVLA